MSTQRLLQLSCASPTLNLDKLLGELKVRRLVETLVVLHVSSRHPGDRDDHILGVEISVGSGHR